MKFAIINDMHIGPTSSGQFRGVQRKLTSESERLIKVFVEEMNNQEHPEFVMNLGDLIEDVNDREIDIVSFKKTIGLLSDLNMPLHVLVGNHDVRTLSQEEIALMLGIKRMYYSFDHGDYHFVVLSFKMTGDHTKNLGDIVAELPKEQVEWLKKDLAQTAKPAVVFSHYGIADDDMKGNFWFEGAPLKAVLRNREEVRELLKSSGKVKAVFSAHQHWNRIKTHDGIPYFTVTSLVENFNNDGKASEAYTIVDLDGNGVKVNVRGNDPAKYYFTFPR
jgi:3',5'-cyclic AMP phosphodiesterase CpdA